MYKQKLKFYLNQILFLGINANNLPTPKFMSVANNSNRLIKMFSSSFSPLTGMNE